LQQSLKQLAQAYKNYFDSLTGKRKGGKVGLPKFKKKSNQQSAIFTTAAFKVSDGIVYLAKIGDLKPIWSRELPSKPSSVTVIKDAANRYFLSFVVDVEPIKTDAKNSGIGIDLGIKTFAVMSDGSKAESPDYSKLDRKLRKLQKKLARQQKESNRTRGTRIKIAKIHKKIADKRNDFLHKLSTKLVSENQVTILEDLNVSGMVKNRKLARVISLQGWREFRELCESKTKKFLDREFRTISRWEPTSQYCSVCGSKWGKLDLSTRAIKCLNCGTKHDRDENAAINIVQVGIGHCHDSKWARLDCKTTSVAS
jgi:putative transposase